MIVGVYRHGQRVGCAGDGVGRLQHLPSVERVGIGVVVVKTDRNLLQDRRRFFAKWSCGVGRKVSETFVQNALGFGEKFEEIVWHGLH